MSSLMIFKPASQRVSVRPQDRLIRRPIPAMTRSRFNSNPVAVLAIVHLKTRGFVVGNILLTSGTFIVTWGACSNIFRWARICSFSSSVSASASASRKASNWASCPASITT